MKIRQIQRASAVLALALWVAAGPSLAADAAGEPAAAVRSFNDALSTRNLDKALAQIAPGSVQFNLRPAHAGMGGAPQALVTDLRAQWSMIGPVVFASTKSWVRKVEIIDSRVEGDVATIWTRTATETVRPDQPDVRRDSFVEIYLLVRRDGQWKIGALADNRKPNDVGGAKNGGP